MKSSHSRFRKLYYATDGFTTQQTALLHNKRFTTRQKILSHNRKLYCTAESLLRNKRFYCTTKSFTTQQKSQYCCRNWKKVPSAARTADKPTLQCFPLDLDSAFVHKLVAVEWYFRAHSAECQAQLPS